MKRSLFALAIGASALLPLGMPQPASAYDYYDGYRGGLAASSATSATTARSSIAIMPSIAITTSANSKRFATAIYLGAWWFGMRRHHEEREINARRADLYRDHERLERYGY